LEVATINLQLGVGRIWLGASAGSSAANVTAKSMQHREVVWKRKKGWKGQGTPYLDIPGNIGMRVLGDLISHRTLHSPSKRDVFTDGVRGVTRFCTASTADPLIIASNWKMAWAVKVYLFSFPPFQVALHQTKCQVSPR